jgi:threonine/homoserine/homoserine lactone efflux protein
VKVPIGESHSGDAPGRVYHQPVTIAQALLSFAAVAALLTIVPGLDTTVVMRSTLTAGRRRGVATAAGVATGSLVWGVAAAVGATALLAASELAYRLLSLAGAAYMVWMGLGLLWRTISRRHRAAAEVEELLPGPRRSLFGAWAQGATTNLLNPKAGVFYLATIPQFIPHGTAPILMGLLLALVHNVIGAVWFGGLIAAVGAAGRWLRNARAQRVIDRITGTVLVAFGVRLVLQPH